MTNPNPKTYRPPSRRLSRCYRHLLGAVAALVLSTAAAQAASVIVLPSGDIGGGIPAPSDLRLSVDGEPLVLRSVEPISSGGGQELWEFVVYADAELSTADGLDHAVRLLTAEAARLTELGTVQIVLADPDPEVLLPATRDAAAVARVLGALVSEAVSTDSLAQKRRRSTAALSAVAGQEEAAARSAIRRESSLRESRRRTLLGWLAIRSSKAPRALFLLADPPLPPPAEYFAQQAGYPDLASDETLAPALDDQQLARLTASLGWATFPIHRRPDGVSGADPLDQMAAETGGEGIRDTGDLSTALEALHQGLRLSFDTLSARSEPLPLEIRTRRPGLRLHHPRWFTGRTPAAVSAARAHYTLEADRPPAGPLGLTAAILLGYFDEPVDADEPSLPDEGSDPELSATLESLVSFPAGSAGPSAAEFRVTVLSRRLDEEPTLEHFQIGGGDLSLSSGWMHRERLEFDEDLQEVAVVVEELTTGAWGTDLAFFSETPLRVPNLHLAATSRPATTAAALPEVTAPTPPATPPPTAAPTATPAADSKRAAATDSRRSSGGADEGVVIRILPPRKTALTGKTRFLTLTTSTAIDRMVFYLDGEEMDADEKAPFAGTLDLGSPARPHLVRAVALSASGRQLAEDELIVNQTGALFQVDITDVTADSATGTYSVEADIDVPPDDRLVRVEFYFNETLQATVDTPPFRARFQGPPATAQDYLRVVAYLGGGDSLEDVRLLGGGPVEEVEVNLVELYVVVTDFAGVPVEDLGQENFSIRQAGRTLPIERFDKAVDVPLVMGLVIDTSASMWALMEETKMAAAQFLGNTLTKKDKAFLVDFSTRPRLAHPATGDLLQLVRAFSRLQPAGFTALYDAIVFTMLQFDEGPGRRALVLLTDGDDYNSRFGPKRCIEYGRSLGIPVYIVTLGALQDSRRGYKRSDLDNITAKTGGRVFYIGNMDELPAAYQQINAELRSQYLLAFSTDTPLGPDELQKLSVTVDNPALTTRTVVGGQQIY